METATGTKHHLSEGIVTEILARLPLRSISRFKSVSKTTKHHLSEGIVTEILARLPLRSISRFKSVSKTLKSTLESVFFRRLFVSLHKNSSSSWSLISWEAKELIGFHGCETWDLPKSLASYIPLPLGFVCKASSNGLVLIERPYDFCYVGNPVLQQWVKIPPCPGCYSVFIGLVTRVDDEDGVVLGFKVVSLTLLEINCDDYSCTMFLYSSETGIWTSKTVHCPHVLNISSAQTLNSKIYFDTIELVEPRVLVAHDFYSESDQFLVVHFPDHSSHSSKSSWTISGGFVMYIESLAQKGETFLKVWRLNNDQYSWKLLWEISIPIVGAPMAMHPFDIDLVYLWCQQSRHLVSCNLRTQSKRTLVDADCESHQDLYVNQSVCDQYLDDEILGSRLSDADYECLIKYLNQFVLPQWIEPVPRPPRAEMIDTTSLLSHIAASSPKRDKTKKRNICNLLFQNQWLFQFLR